MYRARVTRSRELAFGKCERSNANIPETIAAESLVPSA
jgi:hypothetical protein